MTSSTFALTDVSLLDEEKILSGLECSFESATSSQKTQEHGMSWLYWNMRRIAMIAVLKTGGVRNAQTSY